MALFTVSVHGRRRRGVVGAVGRRKGDRKGLRTRCQHGSRRRRIDKGPRNSRAGVELRCAQRRAVGIAAGVAQVIAGVALFTVN